MCRCINMCTAALANPSSLSADRGRPPGDEDGAFAAGMHNRKQAAPPRIRTTLELKTQLLHVMLTQSLVLPARVYLTLV